MEKEQHRPERSGTFGLSEVVRGGTAEDGVRREEKKVQGTFFPPNRPTRHDNAEETLDHGFKGLLGINQKDSGFNLSLLISCGRWDLNPHERNAHKILSLARLPVPTLPLDLRHE